MIKDHNEFRVNMKSRTDESTENLMFLKKARPFTFSEYEKRYQEEKKKLKNAKGVIKWKH